MLPRHAGDAIHASFRELGSFLRAGDLLVVNRSRVRHARLLARRPNGGAAELLAIGPGPDGHWTALVRPGRRLRSGAQLDVAPGVRVRIDSEGLPPDGRRRISFPGWTRDPEDLFAEHGHVPLPPYVRRAVESADRERYQTVYAHEKGSVAAPTAGLHFTTALLDGLRQQGVHVAEIVLHVGPGTFKPVTVADIGDHRVDPEPFVLPDQTADAIAGVRAGGGRVVAVGTTAARVLETRALSGRLVAPGAGATDLVIVPGHSFAVVDALITNFHLPRSSLLLLVAALVGRDRLLAAYRDAIERGYRFYSYGDAMLIA